MRLRPPPLSRVLSGACVAFLVSVAIASHYGPLVLWALVVGGFCMTLIWYPGQVASSTSNLLGIGWALGSPRSARVLGWFVLGGYVAYFVVVLLPRVFPAR